jgi:hypothetical protein
MSRTTPKHWILLHRVSTSIVNSRSGRSHKHISIPVFINHFLEVVRLIDEKNVWKKASAMDGSKVEALGDVCVTREQLEQ